MRANKNSTTRFRLNPENPPVLTESQKKRLEAAEVDYTDIPELPDDFWEQHPPVVKKSKQQITLRVDKDVLDYFCAGGPRYQTRINAVLQSFVQAQKPLVHRRARKYA